MESQIVVLGFEGQLTAQAVLEDILKMQQDGLIELEDAVVVSRGSGTNVEIEQTHSEQGKFALRGSGVGLLAGLLLGGPLVGLAGGAAVGAIAGSLKDYGIADGFIRDVSDELTPKTSALFLMARAENADQVLERLKPIKARVLSTTLPEEQERKLREVLAKEEFD
jgi:uncharacterized membrane protein